MLVLSALLAAALPAVGQPAATAGERAYQARCATCHGVTRNGGAAPALTGAAFRDKWAKRPTGALLSYIYSTMPPDSRGSLAAETYKQITALLQSTSPADAPAVPSKTSAGVGEIHANYDATYMRVIAHRRAVLARVRPVDETMLRHPPEEDWLSWRRTDDGAGFSPLRQIDRRNVQRLTLAWSLSLPAGMNEITPLVHDGVLFIDSDDTVMAIEAISGDVLWTFTHADEGAPPGAVLRQPRNIAIFENQLFVPTTDGRVISLDARTGKPVWTHLLTDAQGPLRMTGGPIVVHGKVIQGITGCAGTSRPGGCFIVALDARNGEELWRFRTVAAPGSPGGDSWNGAPENERFGGSVWLAGSYDPKLNLVFFGTGQTYHIAPLLQPGGKVDPSNAALFTDSTVALDPDGGRLVWYYQHLRRDVWDLDWAYERMIIDLPGRNGHAVATMGKLGILDVMDEASGRYLFSMDLGLQSLVTAIDPATGIKRTDPRAEPAADRAVTVCPYSGGVRSWPATSYDSRKHALYVAAVDSCMDYTWRPGEAWDIVSAPKPGTGWDGAAGEVAALDLVTRKVLWTRRYRAAESSAVLATAGGILFEGDRTRIFRASDSATGAVLWQVRLNSVPSASPISFLAGGVQYIAITAGGGGPNDSMRESITPEISPTPPGTTLWLFRLAPT